MTETDADYWMRRTREVEAQLERAVVVGEKLALQASQWKALYELRAKKALEVVRRYRNDYNGGQIDPILRDLRLEFHIDD